MTTTNLGNTNTAQLIAAARALAICQRLEFQHHISLEAAKEMRSKVSQSISDSEEALAKAEAALAVAKCARLKNVRTLTNRQLALQQLSIQLDWARKQLWSVCSSRDEYDIIAAARRYTEVTRNFTRVTADLQRANASLADADLRIARATDDCEVHRTALRLTEAAYAEAALNEHGLQINAPLHTAYLADGLFELERAVCDAAHAIAGTTEPETAHSFVSTAELPVWQDMLEADRMRVSEIRQVAKLLRRGIAPGVIVTDSNNQ